MGNFNFQLWRVKGGDRLGPSSVPDPHAPPIIIRIPLRGIFPACSAAQLGSPVHYITMTTMAVLGGAVGQLDQFITCSEANKVKTPKCRSHTYRKSRVSAVCFVLQIKAKTDIVCKAKEILQSKDAKQQEKSQLGQERKKRAPAGEHRRRASRRDS